SPNSLETSKKSLQEVNAMDRSTESIYIFFIVFVFISILQRNVSPFYHLEHDFQPHSPCSGQGIAIPTGTISYFWIIHLYLIPDVYIVSRHVNPGSRKPPFLNQLFVEIVAEFQVFEA